MLEKIINYSIHNKLIVKLQRCHKNRMTNYNVSFAMRICSILHSLSISTWQNIYELNGAWPYTSNILKDSGKKKI